MVLIARSCLTFPKSCWHSRKSWRRHRKSCSEIRAASCAARQLSRRVRQSTVPQYEREAGHYHKSIKRGRVYTKLGQMRIRVYSNDPIGHLVEKGWTPKARDGSHGKKQDGKNVFEEAAKGFDEQFQQAAEDALDEVINKL